MFRQRPLLLPSLAFAFGIWCAEFSLLPSSFFAFCALVALIALAHFRPKYPLSLLLALFGAGGLAYQTTQLPLDPTDLRWKFPGQTKLGTVRGHLIESPSIRLSERQGQLHERTVVRLRITAWRTHDSPWEPASGLIIVSSKGVPDPRFFRRQSVEVTGLLTAPSGPLAPGMLDYAQFLRRQGIGFQLLCEAPDDWSIGHEALESAPWSEQFLRWAEKRLSQGLPDDEATRLIWAMALGWRTALSGDMDDVFMQSGTIHVFAISGLHIALIASILVRLLRLAQIPRSLCGLMAAPLLWFYVAATGWQPSAIRSAIMTSVIVGTWTLERPSDLLNSLAAAALTVLIWEPGQLFQAGFLLSFGVVGALTVLSPPIKLALQACQPWTPDPLLPKSLWPTWRGYLEGGRRWFVESLSVGVAALLFSTPFTVAFFHLFSPVALLANLVVVPLSSLVLVANTCSLILPFGTTLWNSAAWVGMHGMIFFSRWCVELPFAWFPVQSLPLQVWVPYGAAVIGVGMGYLLNAQRRALWLIITGVLAGGILIPFWQRERCPVMLVFASGESIWIDQSGRTQDLLVDVGDANGISALLIPALLANGVVHTRTLAVSHGDLRHVGGLDVALKLLKPATLSGPAAQMRSAAFRKIEKLAGAFGIPYHPLRLGENLSGWSVLHPSPTDKFTRADDASLTLKGRLNDWAVVLAPDLGRLGQIKLCERHSTTLSADILITGVPRDGEIASDLFLQKINPRLIIVATGRRLIAERTPQRHRLRLRNREFTVLFTEDLGALQIRFGSRLEVLNARGQEIWSAERPATSPYQGTDIAR